MKMKMKHIQEIVLIIAMILAVVSAYCWKDYEITKELGSAMLGVISGIFALCLGLGAVIEDGE